MTEKAKLDTPARPAATVLLLRDGPEGLEVFMVIRHREVDFASGAAVFPGGRVEEADRAIAARLSASEADVFRVAAVREAFEECGVLLATEGAGGPLIGGARMRAVEAAHRAELNAGARGFAAVLEEEGLVPALDRMVHFAHWITPEGRPKRFDTHFFACAAPEDQLALHDGREAVDSHWIRPARVIEEANAGRMTLVFATRLNLARLARYATVAEALAAAREERVVTVLPTFYRTDAGRFIRIPAEAGYGGDVFPAIDAPAN
ncbi:MAG TPA: NUDIX hydrolase [Acetobacteraceae bacterium]|nr:NUDIX hydrolase [Acetobacteraceae bacterium]